MPVFFGRWIGLLVLALPWEQSPSSLIQKIKAESPLTLVWDRQGLGAELRGNLRYIKEKSNFSDLNSLVVCCSFFLRASCVIPHFQTLRPHPGMWHPGVYGCKTLIHSLPAKLTGTCWNSILWGVLAVALALVLTPKSSVMVSLSARSLLSYGICFFDYELVVSFGHCSDERAWVRCDESHLSCQYWWKSEGRMTAKYTKVKI